MFDVPDWTLPPIAVAAAPKPTSKSARRRARQEKCSASDRPDASMCKAVLRKQDAAAVHSSDTSSPSQPANVSRRQMKREQKARLEAEQSAERMYQPTGSAPSAARSLPKTELHIKLQGARFRSLNEKLYVSSSKEAMQYFKNDPTEFERYHEGFRQQTCSWPTNPVDMFIERIRGQKQTKLVIADMGCGDAAIASAFESDANIKVHSFDLVANNTHVTVASMTKVPLADASTDIVVFCLALMNTDYAEALREARRILRPGTGQLWIAEVASRFANGPAGDTLRDFRAGLEAGGFRVNKCTAHEGYFVSIYARLLPNKECHGSFTMPPLRACVYKRR